jgi:hypothetical protein
MTIGCLVLGRQADAVHVRLVLRDEGLDAVRGRRVAIDRRPTGEDHDVATAPVAGELSDTTPLGRSGSTISVTSVASSVTAGRRPLSMGGETTVAWQEERMSADESAIDTEQLPIPTGGLLMTHFLVVRDVRRARAFYAGVRGGRLVMGENPCIVGLANCWEMSHRARVSSFMNLRVADIAGSEAGRADGR